MGDRVSILLLENGEFKAELYDHWGGEFYRGNIDKIMKAIEDLAEASNDFENFLSMLVHWWREARGIPPTVPNTIYLSTDGWTAPDNPFMIVDYHANGEKRKEVQIKFIRCDIIDKDPLELYKENKGECIPIPINENLYIFECEGS